MAYAATTEVSSDRSRAEIERTLERYGATSFAYMSQPGRAQIAFEMQDRRIRFTIPLPAKDSREFALTPTGKRASSTAAQAKYEQAIRQRWRALLLVTKAKLEAVESGISTFEQEFFGHVLLPSGRTVYEEVGPQVAQIISTGDMGRLSLEA